MTALQAIVLGAVQGLTEFLPISSSAHLILVPELLGWPQQGFVFDVSVHLATLGAILWSFSDEIRHLVRGFFRGTKEARTLVAKLAVGTVPAVVFGYFFSDLVTNERVVPVIAAMLIFWGIMLWIADHVARSRKISHSVGASWTQTVIIGIAQALALIPGTSRSGATMTVGLLTGLDHNNAARFSFLLAIPAVIAAAVKTAIDAAQTGMTIPMEMLGLGFLSSFVFGMLAIKLLFVIITYRSFHIFALYRIALGVLLLYLVTANALGT